MPIEEILPLYGQEGYRKLEANALDRVVENYDRMILAVARGIVSEPETYKALLSRFHTVWLKASPEEHMDRVRAQGDERPMTGNADAMDQLKSILTRREALYAEADAHLDTSGKQLDTALSDLFKLLDAKAFFA